MSELPVREMILYKHGVGFFRREGAFTSEEVTLTFRHDAINDVLKSLVVLDQAGGQVLGIHYQTPFDIEDRLANSSIRLSGTASLFDLLCDLRGRRVELALTNTIVRGRLIGMDVESEEKVDRSLVSIIDEAGGQVRVFPLSALQSVRILDEQADHDLRYFLDTSVSEDLRRSVHIRLSPGEHRLVVYYVAPSPTWRVSYRLVAESGGSEASGKALLQGWGLFDNRLDEDLENVAVTLVVGQPISFIYDLYASRIPERPIVEEEDRTVDGPVEFRGGPALRAEIARKMTGRMMDAGVGFDALIVASESGADTASLDALAWATPIQTEAREAGEFFRYVVTTPVSVKRGESALVPIVGTGVDYSKELLYNGVKLPDHPVAAIRFDNATGLTLERGPVTVIEDGEYQGEAIVPFTKPDNEVYLPYAVELGVTVTEHSRRSTEMAGLHIRDRYLIINEYEQLITTYTLENTTDRKLTITIEASVMPDYELFDTPKPDVATAQFRRWRVDVPAHGAAEFVRRERHLIYRHEEIKSLDYRRLQQYLEGRWLDHHTFERLSALLDSLAFIRHARQEQEALQGERGTVYERQGQLRENLRTLKAEGEEAALRSRMLRQLEDSEDRLAQIEARLTELGRLIKETEVRIEQTLDELSQEVN